MNKMRLLLTLCTLSVISSLQSAASSALMKAMEHTRATSVKPVDIQITQGASGNKLVTISRDGHRIVAFDAKLLADHDFSGFIQEFKGADKDKAFAISAHQLFDDLNNDQINILIKALNEDISPARAETFVDNLDQNDLGWLANKANSAEMSNIYNALTTKFANNLKLAQSLYNERRINDDVSEIVNDKIDMKPVDNAIFSRIPHSSCHPISSDGDVRSTTFNTDNSKVLITTINRVILLDLNTNQQTILYTRNQQLDGSSFTRSAIFNIDNSKALIATENRVILLDLNTNQQTILYTRNQQLDGYFIESAALNANNNKILIETENRVILINAQNPNQQTILYTRNPRLHGDWITSATFNTDNSKIFITTVDRVILVNTQNPNQQTIFYTINPQLDGDCIRSATFNPDNSKVLITTINRVILLDLNTNQQTILYTRNQQLDGSSFTRSAIFNIDNSQILVATDNRVFLLDLNTNHQTILYTRDPQLDGDWIDSATFNANNSKILITTNHRAILCQISYLKVLKSLNIDQKLFLINTSKMWEQNKPYIIKSDEEQEIYNSLPDELKKPELFEIAPEPCKR